MQHMTNNISANPLPTFTIINDIRCPQPDARKVHFKQQFLTVYGLMVTLTSELFIVKSNQFVFVPKCTKVVNLVKFPEAVYKTK